MEEFESWLMEKLKALKTDEATFGAYIKSILEETDEDLEEKIDSLDGLLKELEVENVEILRDEILTRWKSVTNCDQNLNGESSSKETQLDELLQSATIAEKAFIKPSTSSSSATDQKLREKILSQLSDSSSDSEEDQEEAKPGISSTTKKKNVGSALTEFGKNTNVEKVLTEQKELKDRAKADHQKKKEKDKDDRAKQKAAAQERKDKAKKKSAKVERKR